MGISRIVWLDSPNDKALNDREWNVIFSNLSKDVCELGVRASCERQPGWKVEVPLNSGPR